MNTESNQKITYVRKAVVQLAIKLHIEKFDSAATDLWSEGVSSKVVGSCAVWKIHVWRDSGGGTSIYLDLVGPMRANKESLEATFHLYLVGESHGPVDSLLRGTKLFQKGGSAGLFGNDYWAGVRSISRDRVKMSLQTDGSLVVCADVEFLAPISDGLGEVCLACALRCDETQKLPNVKSSSDSYSDNAYSDYSSTEVEKRSINKVLSARNVIAMAEHAGTHSIEMLKEACLQLLARQWGTVFESAEWRDLERDRPKLAADLIFGVATLTDAHSAKKEFKEAFIKLVASRGRTVYESEAWRELKETKPKLALELAEGIAAVFANKG